MLATKILLCILGMVLRFCAISSAEDNYALKLDGDSVAAMVNTRDGANALLLYGNGLRKIDSSGKKIWQKTYKSDSASDTGFPRFVYVDLAQLPDGGYILAGSKKADAGYYIANIEAGLLKVSSTGNINWQKGFTESTYESVFSSVAAYGDGFAATGDRIPGFFEDGITGIIVASFNSDGSMNWGKIFDSTSATISNPKIIKTSAEGLTIACATSDGSSVGGALILKLDTEGNITSKKVFQKKNIVLTTAVLTADNGAFLLFGHTGGSGPGIETQSVLAVRLTSDGTVLWGKRFLVKGISSGGVAVTQTRDGSFAVTGLIFSSPFYGFLTLIGADGKVISSVRLPARTDGTPNLILPSSDAGYIVSDASYLFKVNSERRLPGCLFHSASSVRKKFGKLRTLNPGIRTSTWSPDISNEHELHSRKYHVHDSPACQ